MPRSPGVRLPGDLAYFIISLRDCRLHPFVAIHIVEYRVRNNNNCNNKSSGRPMTARGAAWRRKQRRLRSMLLHERQTVAVAFAESQHHSAQRPTMARGGEWWRGSEQYYTAKIRKTPTPQLEHFELSFDEEPGSSRPHCLGEPRGQAGVLRHVVEHVVDVCPFVQVLDAPVPQMGDSALPEQVIDVPKISHFSVQQRVVDRDLIRRCRNSWWKCRPFCLLLRSGSSVTSRSLTFRFAVEVFKVFAQDRFQQLHPQLLAPRLKLFKFFSHFRQVRAGVAADTSSWTRAAYEVAEAEHLAGAVHGGGGCQWRRGARVVPDAVVGAPVGLDSAAVLLVAGRGGRVPVRRSPMASPVGGGVSAHVPAVLRVRHRASDPDHRRSVGHFSFTTETGMHSVNCAADR